MPQIQGRYQDPLARRYASQAPEEVIVVKDSPGILYSLFVMNLSSSAVSVYVFDNGAASGDLLYPPIRLSASGGSVNIDPEEAEPFVNGLTVAPSSALSPFTPTGTDDLMVVARYR